VVGGQRQEKGDKWRGAYCIFFVQYACGGFVAFFLPWGLQYGVCAVVIVDRKHDIANLAN